MDTTQKNHPEDRKRKAPQGQSAGQRPARPRPEEEPRRQRPAQAQQGAPKRKTAAEPRKAAPEGVQRKAAPEGVQRKAAPEAAQRKQSRPAPSQRPTARPAAPQGTGPRKSAPQRSPQDAVPRKRLATEKPTKQNRTLKQNSLQSFISGVRGAKQDPEDTKSEQAKKRRQKRSAEAARKRKRAQMHDTPAVIYTAPTPFNRNRLFIQLLSVVAVVVAMVGALSVFFKVKTITVSGAEKYSTWAVREASGIKEGDNLLTFSIPRASGQIIAQLSYVDKVRIGIKLPDTVNIYIEELDVAYAIKDSDGTWWLMTSDGRMVEQTNSGVAADHTQVLGVTVETPQVNEYAVATEEVPTETNEAGELVPVTVTGAQRLSAALQILKALEANDIVGEAASVDVTRLEDVILWYGTRYQVNLGGTNDMEYKIACMNDTILQLSDYQTGVLDVSFTYWKTQVGYTPFE